MKRILFLSALSVCTIGLSLFISLGSNKTIEGSTSTADITGHAWSSNIGWISFKGNTYGVSINQETGVISGYAWSSNIGWISFNTTDLIGCPINPCLAKLSGNAFSGWAKALAAKGNGWDGWIRIAGTGYGLTLSGEDIIGYMWGGPVVGWVKSITLSTTFEDRCGNGIDDDGDGVADELDPDCDDNPTPKCNNKYDDDGDGLIDFGLDPGCSSLNDNSEEDTSETPEVELLVGIGSPSFESISLGIGGGTVVLGIDVTHASSTTSCTRKVVSLSQTTNTNVPTGGAASFSLVQSLSITESSKVIVTCETAGRQGSDSVDILIKQDDDF